MSQPPETTKPLREIHGLKAAKIQAGPEAYGQPVTVTDSPEFIVLNIGSATYPAGLTPAEARYIARQLSDAADRMEACND